MTDDSSPTPASAVRSAFFAPARMFGEAWRFRRLLWSFVVRDLRARHQTTVLGGVWLILGPGLMLALYTFVFGVVFGGRFGKAPDETPLDYAVAVFVGLSVFHLFSEAIASATSSIVGNAGFVKKVVFPLVILPTSNVVVALVSTTVSLVLAVLAAAILNGRVHPTLLWMPVILLPFTAFVMGLALLLAALGVFVRDLAHSIAVVAMAMLFASAIFYPVSSIPEAAWKILSLNPVLQAVDMMRDILLWGTHPRPGGLAVLVLEGVLALVLGASVFAWLKEHFADAL